MILEASREFQKRKIAEFAGGLHLKKFKRNKIDEK